MRKGRFEKPKEQVYVWQPVVVMLVIIIMMGVLLSCCNQFLSKQELSNSDSKESTHAQNPNSIAIPGYEILELRADNENQTLCLPNPQRNMCYFQISLYLEDGTLLWKSELIEPGAVSKPMILMQELQKGTYPNARLKYACFKQADLSPLNGAEMKVTLWVK